MQMLTVCESQKERQEVWGKWSIKEIPRIKKISWIILKKTDPIHSSLGMVSSGIPEMRTDLKQKQRLNLACRLQGQNTWNV